MLIATYTSITELPILLTFKQIAFKPFNKKIAALISNVKA